MKYIVANFKLNGNSQFISSYCKDINSFVNNPENLLIALPSPYLHFADSFAQNGIQIGAQNISEYSSGAYTGEVSAQMVKDLGATFTLIGHSERRNIFGESLETIANKMEVALKNNIKVILCVGEKLEDKTKYKSVISCQLKSALKNVDLSNIIIAYEPVWAIGTGRVATTKDIVRVHGYIKDFLLKNYKANVPVLYGGSVKASNSAEILELDQVDGVLVGGASLKADEFSKIYFSQF